MSFADDVWHDDDALHDHQLSEPSKDKIVPVAVPAPDDSRIAGSLSVDDHGGKDDVSHEVSLEVSQDDGQEQEQEQVQEQVQVSISTSPLPHHDAHADAHNWGAVTEMQVEIVKSRY